MSERWLQRVCALMTALLWLSVWPSPAAAGTVTLAVRDVALSEVMSMLSRQERINILLGREVEGTVSVNLYELEVDEAVRSIAHAAGYAVERQGSSYFIVPRTEAGKYAPDGLTRVVSFEIHYADPEALESMLKPYLSTYGKLTMLPERGLMVVEDMPEFVDRIEGLVQQLDSEPRQVLIEARILEIKLDDEESYGVDWRKLFSYDGGEGSYGTEGLALPTEANRQGFFFDLTTPNIEVALDALKARGRLRTLSTPKLLALENQEASVIVGDRRGYAVTTTINQVTTESIEFLESGVILRVIPSVDASGAVMMYVHPEISTGEVDNNGIPSQLTTEVTTQLLVPDGQTVFIGGLIKHTLAESRRGVPVLGDVPGIGRLFSNRRQTILNTETVILITPRIVERFDEAWNVGHVEEVEKVYRHVNERIDALDGELNRFFPDADVNEPLGLELSPALSPGGR